MLNPKISVKTALKYFWSNFTGTLVDTFFLWLLSNYVFQSYVGKYVIAPAISFQLAMFKNFLSSYFWIWKDRVDKNLADFFKRLFYYNLNSVAVFFLKLGLILVIEFITKWDVVICNLIALMFTGLVNLALQDKLIFKSTHR